MMKVIANILMGLGFAVFILGCDAEPPIPEKTILDIESELPERTTESCQLENIKKLPTDRHIKAMGTACFLYGTKPKKMAKSSADVARDAKERKWVKAFYKKEYHYDPSKKPPEFFEDEDCNSNWKAHINDPLRRKIITSECESRKRVWNLKKNNWRISHPSEQPEEQQ